MYDHPYVAEVFAKQQRQRVAQDYMDCRKQGESRERADAGAVLLAVVLTLGTVLVVILGG
jgi:hypothetical protein